LQKNNNLIEAKIRKMVREILKESLILEISSEEKTKAMAKSNERVPFNAELMKQAILQGREVGINYRSKNDKYEMPVTKARIIHPVAMGTDKRGNIVIRGLHITGQSEKAARISGVRSAEVEAERDGMNAWRLFRADNLKSMWFTDRFFSDNIPGYNPNDSAMSSVIASYNPVAAKKYQDELVAKEKQSQLDVPPGEGPVVPGADKDVDQMGYEDLQEKKKKNIRGFFK
jgi:hypothetical protein